MWNWGLFGIHLDGSGIVEIDVLAEGAGFEPAVGRPTIDFKSTAFDHSASPPSDDLL